MMRESLAVQERLQEGREEGKLSEARSALLMIIENRFPVSKSAMLSNQSLILKHCTR